MFRLLAKLNQQVRGKNILKNIEIGSSGEKEVEDC
jgi:hypothetical protein